MSLARYMTALPYVTENDWRQRPMATGGGPVRWPAPALGAQAPVEDNVQSTNPLFLELLKNNSLLPR